LESVKWQAFKKEGLTKGQLKAKRREGLVPAVLNKKGQEPLTFFVNSMDIKNKPSGNIKITLEIEDQKEPILCFLKSIDRDYTTNPIHADFQELTIGQELDVEVHIKLIGEPKGVKSEGGILNVGVTSIKIRTLPKNMPENIEVDISMLKVGDAIDVKDIKLGEDYTLIEPTEGLVASVIVPKEEAESEMSDEMPEIEIIKEKKEEA